MEPAPKMARRSDRAGSKAISSYLLGVDGGGTKTEAIVVDGSLSIMGRGLSGASNPLRVGMDQAASNIRRAVLEAAQEAGIKLKDVAVACVALAGISHPVHFQMMREALDRALRVKKLQLTTDARAALAGALDAGPGVVVIAGTGSIAFGINSQGQEARSGGWGYALGDEGSGYDIASRALRAVVASFDGRLQETLLTDLICRKLGVKEVADLPTVIYDKRRAWMEIAELAKLVTEAARRGDQVAISILAEAGRELGCLARSVIEKLNMRRESFRVAYVGGVFSAGRYLLDPFAELVRRVAPGAQIGPPLASPVIGAAKLASAHQPEL
jgi:N-acetylglucosamine kinase-like BadF-type ATPase